MSAANSTPPGPDHLAAPDDPVQPVLLVILDGFGINPSRVNNAVAEADTPNFDRYFSRYPYTVLQSSGKAVGLPDGQMGNSEVGHVTLGSGVIVRQDLVNIDDAIESGAFFTNPVLCAAADKARVSGRPLHLLGLVSAGGVHSHIRHINALIELCRRRGAVPMMHVITDGRDTPPKSALNFLPAIEDVVREAEGSVATVCGRYYAMDRDRRWDRTRAAWLALVRGEGRRAGSLREAVAQAYDLGEGDEFIKPTILPEARPITSQDTVIFFNFRKDRPRQIIAALALKQFSAFDRGDGGIVDVICMMEYDERFKLPYAFKHERPPVTLAETISKAGRNAHQGHHAPHDDPIGLRQFHCAETEKYAHVTYFFNGGQIEPFSGEDRVMIESPRVATYDLTPGMSAAGVADAVIDALRSRQYAFLVVNFANGDMVGHTAVRQKVIQAVEALDCAVGRVLDCAVDQDYSVVLTADHGNCEELVDPVSGEPHTQHTLYPVPCLVIDAIPRRLVEGSGLSSIAPTVLQLMGLPQPSAMSGRSLLLEP